MAQRPSIGILCDVTETTGRMKVECGLAYSQNVWYAGGTPLLLPPIEAALDELLNRCDGLVFTGGNDLVMEHFGGVTDPRAERLHPRRQAFEMAVLARLAAERPQLPILGVCLGMQVMCMHAGGAMNQYLPDTLETHAQHRNATHEVAPLSEAAAVQLAGARGVAEALRGPVASNHKQAVVRPGAEMQVLACSSDGVIEAVAHRERKFYVGVQWHPERTADAATGVGVFTALVRAAAQP